MDLGTLILIAITVVIHLIGIGVFLFWFAIGRPMSKQQLEGWWRGVHFLPAWIRNHKREQFNRNV